MCLIICGPSARVRATLLNTRGLIDDIFAYNADGVGVMYKNKKGLRVVKRLPQTLREVTSFIDTLPQDDRNLAMHWRMKTHGDIDMANCHPYDVVPGKVAMMHNGILRDGNAADKSKSDTWHFIQSFLTGPVAEHPRIVHNPQFVELVANYIGDNRFVFMDDAGEMSIVNREQGVDIGGLWFSNTYAWDPSTLDPAYGPRNYGYTNWLERHWPDDGSYVTPGRHNHTKSLGPTEAGTMPWLTDFIEAVIQGDADEAAKHLRQWPFLSVKALKERFTPYLARHVERKKAAGELGTYMSKRCAEILSVVQEPTHTELGRMANDTPAAVAEVICYYVDWVVKGTAPEPPARVISVPDEEESAFDVFEYTYKGHDVDLWKNDTGFWEYMTYDADAQCVDEANGFTTIDEAREWAYQQIDAALMHEEAAVDNAAARA